MIFLCVGLTGYHFDRLLRIVDELCEEGFLNGKELVAQIGITKYSPRNYKSFGIITRAEFQRYIEEADIIVSHAGTGCVIPLLKLGKKVIVFPRQSGYGEHIDDHQLELQQFCTEKGYTLGAKSKEELKEAFKQVKNFKPKLFVSNNAKINQLIIDFIENSFVEEQ